MVKVTPDTKLESCEGYIWVPVMDDWVEWVLVKVDSTEERMMKCKKCGSDNVDGPFVLKSDIRKEFVACRICHELTTRMIVVSKEKTSINKHRKRSL